MCHTKVELGYREVKKIIESSQYLGKTISRDVYDYHIKKMRRRKELLPKNEKLRRGQKNPLRLSNKTIEEIRLGIYNINTIKNNRYFSQLEFTENEKRKFAYQFLFYTMAQPYNVILIRDNDGITKVSLKKFIGLHRGSSEFFSYLSYSVNLIEYSIELLYKEKIIEIFQKGTDKLFNIINRRLIEFVRDCQILFDTLILIRMYTQWQNIKKPSKNEVKWFELIYGKRNAYHKFIKLYLTLKKKKSSSYYNFKYKKEKTKNINSLDIAIFEKIKNLEIKYEDIKSKYPIIFEIILQTICPKFYRDFLEKYYKEKLKKSIRIPKIKPVSLKEDFIVVTNNSLCSYSKI